MHAAVHGSLTYGCQLVKKSKFMQKCINLIVGDVTGEVSLPRAPHWLGGGDV